MKLLASSLSVSSSTSNVSFDPKICTSTSATAGCLTGILRRILCSRSLPTHPADHITDANYKNRHVDALDRIDESKVVSPGIVARLMGLYSLPAEIGFLNKQVNPSSITRSRSMNSADYYKQDSPDLVHGKHKRVNSALSFRDMPAYFEIENEEYFVLTFDKKSERKEMRSKRRKCKGKNGELKQRKYGEKENKAVEKNTGKQEEANRRRVLSVLNEENMESSRFVQKKEISDGAKSRKKKKKTQNRLESQCSSEDSSPVSVLDFDHFILEHEDVHTSEEDSKAEGCNSSRRRKLSADLENHGRKSPCKDSNSMEDDPKTVEAKNLRSRDKDCHSEMNLECWDAVCRTSEAEVAISTWFCTQNEQIVDISADFGSKILDQLLDELVVQHFWISPINNLNLYPL